MNDLLGMVLFAGAIGLCFILLFWNFRLYRRNENQARTIKGLANHVNDLEAINLKLEAKLVARSSGPTVDGIVSDG